MTSFYLQRNSFCSLKPRYGFFDLARAVGLSSKKLLQSIASLHQPVWSTGVSPRISENCIRTRHWPYNCDLSPVINNSMLSVQTKWSETCVVGALHHFQRAVLSLYPSPRPLHSFTAIWYGSVMLWCSLKSCTATPSRVDLYIYFKYGEELSRVLGFFLFNSSHFLVIQLHLQTRLLAFLKKNEM